jgi:hypothetical protein
MDEREARTIDIELRRPPPGPPAFASEETGMFTAAFWSAIGSFLAGLVKGLWGALIDFVTLSFEDYRWFWFLAGFLASWPVVWLYHGIVAIAGWAGRLLGWL